MYTIARDSPSIPSC